MAKSILPRAVFTRLRLRKWETERGCYQPHARIAGQELPAQLPPPVWWEKTGFPPLSCLMPWLQVRLCCSARARWCPTGLRVPPQDAPAPQGCSSPADVGSLPLFQPSDGNQHPARRGCSPAPSRSRVRAETGSEGAGAAVVLGALPLGSLTAERWAGEPRWAGRWTRRCPMGWKPVKNHLLGGKWLLSRVTGEQAAAGLRADPRVLVRALDAPRPAQAVARRRWQLRQSCSHLRRGRCLAGTGWPWASSVPWLPRRSMHPGVH